MCFITSRSKGCVWYTKILHLYWMVIYDISSQNLILSSHDPIGRGTAANVVPRAASNKTWKICCMTSDRSDDSQRMLEPPQVIWECHKVVAIGHAKRSFQTLITEVSAFFKLPSVCEKQAFLYLEIPYLKIQPPSVQLHQSLTALEFHHTWSLQFLFVNTVRF